MEWNLETTERQHIYSLMGSCIVPRPIAWVSTQDKAGVNNIAPFSFFNGVSSNPPAISLAIAYNRGREDGRKDTLQNILDQGEFVVNVVTQATGLAMVATAVDYPADVDEFAVAKLTPVPSKTVRPPRIAESPACFECTYYESIQVGNGPGSSTLVIGIIQHIYVDDAMLNEAGEIDLARMHIIGRVAGQKGYCAIHDTFDLSL
jgi:flavin reductase (DIM6/NTAB) family NADH-FMN oxidoreductase RutF